MCIQMFEAPKSIKELKGFRLAVFVVRKYWNAVR